MSIMDRIRAAQERLKQEKQPEQARQIERAPVVETKREISRVAAPSPKERGPAKRALPEYAGRLKEANQERPKEPEKPKEREAERMELQPTGLQREPSIGGPGQTFTNSRARPTVSQRIEEAQREHTAAMQNQDQQQQQDRGFERDR